MTPTPIPTPIPWATLTPFPTSSGVIPLDFTGAGEGMAESLVQGYQVANNAGALDMVMFAILLFLVIGGVWSVIKRVQAL